MRACVSMIGALLSLASACDRSGPAPIATDPVPIAPEPGPPPPEPEAVIAEPTAAVIAQPSAAEPLAAETDAPATPARIDEGEDVLARVLARNARRTPRRFRAGHVRPRRLPSSAIQRTDRGFRVRLPSRAPVVTPTVHRGLVLASGGFQSSELYAFRAETGELAWAISLDDDGPSVAACEDDVCVINTESCTIYALDAASGRMLWSWWLGDPLMSAPAIASGLVYTAFPAGGGRDSHVLAAFDLRTGEHRWGRWIDSDVMSAPVIDGGRLYAATFAGTLYELDPTTGEILAARRTRATSAPVVAAGQLSYTRRTDARGSGEVREGLARHREGRALVTAERRAVWLDGRVQARSAYARQGSALDSSNGFGGGAPASANARAAFANVGRGSVSTLQAYQGSRMAHRDGGLYATFGDRVVSTDAESGSERWSVPLAGALERAGGALGTAPALAGDSLFVATLAGQVLRIDPSTGAVRERYDAGAPLRSQPAIVDGWIYVGTENGRLVAIDTGDRTLTGWSTWGANAARTGTPER